MRRYKNNDSTYQLKKIVFIAVLIVSSHQANAGCGASKQQVSTTSSSLLRLTQGAPDPDKDSSINIISRTLILIDLSAKKTFELLAQREMPHRERKRRCENYIQERSLYLTKHLQMTLSSLFERESAPVIQEIERLKKNLAILSTLIEETPQSERDTQWLEYTMIFLEAHENFISFFRRSHHSIVLSCEITLQECKERVAVWKLTEAENNEL